MDKTLTSVPILLGKENYRDWQLAIKGAAFWGGYWQHYISDDDVKKLQVGIAESDKNYDKIMEENKEIN
jgi:hypothetical protein